MVQVDLPGAFAIGQIFALLKKKYLRKEESKFNHGLMAPIFCFSPSHAAYQ